MKRIFVLMAILKRVFCGRLLISERHETTVGAHSTTLFETNTTDDIKTKDTTIDVTQSTLKSRPKR